MKTSIRFITPALILSAAAIAPLTAQNHPPKTATDSALAASQPILGVVAERVPHEIRHQLPLLKPGAGLIVRRVLPDSPAAKAGVENLDILLHWDHQILVHPAQLQILVSSGKPGDQATLEFLHRGVVTRAQITLVQRSELQPRKHKHHPESPHAAFRHPLLSPELARQAVEAISQSGIDPNTIGQALKGLNLENIDPEMVDLALKSIDFNGIIKNLEELNNGGQAAQAAAPKATAPKAAAPSKIILIAPDGTRTEIPLDKAMQAGGSPADALKGIDLSKLDPAAILSGKILLVQPDGTEQQINPGELLKDSGAIDELLKGFGQHPH